MPTNTPQTAIRPNDPACVGVVTLDFRSKPLSLVLQELEKEYFSYVLTEAGGNKAKAARLAGLAKDTFHRRIGLYNLKAIFRCV